MKISKIPGLGRFGIFIDDVDFTTITNDEWMEIGKLHLQNLVTIIRDCKLTRDKQTYFCTRFGESRNGLYYRLLEKYPGKSFMQLAELSMKDDPSVDEIDRLRLKNILKMQEVTADGKYIMRVTGKRDGQGDALGMFAEGELLWHSNESGTLTFTPGVGLLGAENMIGSSTGFLTTTDYYENVSNAFRSELDEMILIHSFTPGRINPGLRMEQDEVMHANMCPEDDVEIPMVITSPGGIKGLHYSINTIHCIKGLSKEASDKIFETINKELFVNKYIYDHWYQSNNDFCLFDNSITLHRRLGDIKDRLCYRLQFDYNYITSTPYIPYIQEEFRNEYLSRMKKITSYFN